ncbi:MAG TPA: hypothetical protein VEC57_07985 [Candidatus Limnocylindrales bacterium]|nr:hypothetical protein [Candidatus Limnocylindrales bacterium]
MLAERPKRGIEDLLLRFERRAGCRRPAGPAADGPFLAGRRGCRAGAFIGHMPNFLSKQFDTWPIAVANSDLRGDDADPQQGERRTWAFPTEFIIWRLQRRI